MDYMKSFPPLSTFVMVGRTRQYTISFLRQYVVVSDVGRTWEDAEAYCNLANVTSPEEGEKVKALLQRDGVEQAWFGLHRDSWVWTDGSATSYTSWLAGQPNNAGGSQGCVYMEKEKWNDFPCTDQYYVLCQSKATLCKNA
uniref:C-type lectin domain-containing protein n=1 Tax=Oryzias sinensis TaxID=183150 RepID=A0A8C7Z4J6_9TELE